jgi:hypothetical protein
MGHGRFVSTRAAARKLLVRHPKSCQVSPKRTYWSERHHESDSYLRFAVASPEMESTNTLSTPELSDLVPKPTFQYATVLSRPFAAFAVQRINITEARTGKPVESTRADASKSGLLTTAAQATDAMRQFSAGDAAYGTAPLKTVTRAVGQTGCSGPNFSQSREATPETTACASRSVPTHPRNTQDAAIKRRTMKQRITASPKHLRASPRFNRSLWQSRSEYLD